MSATDVAYSLTSLLESPDKIKLANDRDYQTGGNEKNAGENLNPNTINP
jgi:hypothetical protein